MASAQTARAAGATATALHKPTEVPELKQRSWGDWAFPTSVAKATQAEVNMLHHHGVRTPHTRSVRNGIHTLHFEAPYEGAPKLVMIHGFGAGAGLYSMVFRDLTQEFEVLAIDLPGCGLSPRVEYTPQSTQESQEWFLSALDGWFEHEDAPTGKVFLLGHSLGGYLGALWALRRPERIAHLLLASPVGVPHEPQLTEEQAERYEAWPWRTLSWLWSRNATPQSLVRLVGPWGRSLTDSVVRRRFQFAAQLQPVHVPSLSEYIYQISAAPGSGEWALKHLLKPGAWAHDPIGPRLVQAGRAGAIQYPITMLYGSHDWMSPSAGEEVADELRPEGVDVTVHVVPQAGHQLFMENPQGFAATAITSAYQKSAQYMGRTAPVAGAVAAGAAAAPLGADSAAAQAAAAHVHDPAESELSPSHHAHAGTEVPAGDVDESVRTAVAASGSIVGGPLAPSG